MKIRRKSCIGEPFLLSCPNFCIWYIIDNEKAIRWQHKISKIVTKTSSVIFIECSENASFGGSWKAVGSCRRLVRSGGLGQTLITEQLFSLWKHLPNSLMKNGSQWYTKCIPRKQLHLTLPIMKVISKYASVWSSGKMASSRTSATHQTHLFSNSPHQLAAQNIFCKPTRYSLLTL